MYPIIKIRAFARIFAGIIFNQAREMKLLVANRGEIAIRIFRAAAELDIETVAVFSEDDSRSLHIRSADYHVGLEGRGVRAYLDMDAILSIAAEHGCTAIHPGYGFLSENPDFAQKCSERGLIFVGPAVENLRLFGNKSSARDLAVQCGVPVPPGTSGAITFKEAVEFIATMGDDTPVMIKAAAGGGGRGMRSVRGLSELEAAFPLCRSEAESSFGNGDLYLEKKIERARHIEIQIVGDGLGNVNHFGERECTLQRRNQKLIEIAPSPSISDDMRRQLIQAAVKLAAAANYRNLGTFEFLVETDEDYQEKAFHFMEVNPRLQVEHTVTEEAFNVDLVRLQLEIAKGKTLPQLGLQEGEEKAPSGYALQARINMEQLEKDGSTLPSSGTIEQFIVPSGRGIRVDTFGYPGYTTSSNFDSLLAKLVVSIRSADYRSLVRKARRTLSEFRITGIDTNLALLRNLLEHPDVESNRVSTAFLEDHIDQLLTPVIPDYREQQDTDKLPHTEPSHSEAPENTVAVKTRVPGSVVSIDVVEGDVVSEKQTVMIIESMKMQHVITAQTGGIVRMIAVKQHDALVQGQPLIYIEPVKTADEADGEQESVDLDEIRPDLKEVLERHRKLMDKHRAEAVKKRHECGQRTARENIKDLLDEGSFIEYGGLAVAAQRSRLTPEELMEKSPADGLIAGMGTVNTDRFGYEASRCLVLSYDYTVLAGTQGLFNHKKTDRMLHLAKQWKLPLILFAEGGGGRPGDVDGQLTHVAGLDVTSFERFAELSALVPLVGIVSGRCFAGNAALLGCTDVIIATEDSNIGMGGPAMVEGGGLGRYRPEEIGPIDIQANNGVVDIRVRDEAEAVRVTKQYLSYFQGNLSDWECADQRRLRRCIPENRLRVYDIRTLIRNLADCRSFLEIRSSFGIGIVTGFMRIEGVPFGLMANNPMHLGGAIDADAADKASRFMQLCDAFDLPIVVLSDTPGFMVGPEAEKSAQVRHFARMFVNGASITVPIFSVILRKGYGLGSMAMVGGSYHAPFFNISWPTGEFGGMGLEGAVKLGFKKELEAVKDPEERQKLYEQMVAMAYEHGKATNMASYLEIDGVIDPVETRDWIMRGFRSLPAAEKRTGKKRPNVDAW